MFVCSKYSYMKIRIVLVVLLSFFSLGVIAQPPPPSERGSDENEPTGTIGSGLIIMLAMAAGYGAKKVYDARRRLLE